MEQVYSSPYTKEPNLVTEPVAYGNKKQVTFYSGEPIQIRYRIEAYSLYSRRVPSVYLYATFAYNCSSDFVKIRYNTFKPNDEEQDSLTDAFFFNMIAPSKLTLNYSHAGDFNIDIMGRI